MEKRLNSNHLKFFAIIAMTLDHSIDLFFPGFPSNPIAICFHIIGRLTAPIMWFFISEGYFYTRNPKKYLLRLFIFAIVSHFAYCFAFGIDFIPFKTGIFNQTSVMYPLFVAVLVLYLQDNDFCIKKWVKEIIIFVLIWSAFPADWSCIAVLVICAMYRNRGNLKKQMFYMMLWVSLYAIVSFFCVNKVYGLIQPFVILVYPLLKMYNGERGKLNTKWLFYIYYPLHLFIIGIFRILIYGNISLLF